MTETTHEWWGQLRHEGVLVTPQLLDEFFPALPAVRHRDYDRLRDAWLTFEAHAEESEARRAFADAVLREFCGLVGWQKGPQVAKAFKAVSPTGQRLRPDWVLTDRAGEQGVLAVAFDDADRIGIGRGKRSYARLVELLRATGIPLGVLTNGRQFRLVHAGPDYAAWAEWDAASWFDEAGGREQLRGLRALLGHDSLLEPAEEGGLVAAIQASRHRQGDLAQVLGEQVRQAVEHVIDALDGALTRDPDLLRQVHKDPRSGQDIDEQAVLGATYQAATRVVMRLVVLLYAEARELLPRSNETYHRSYGVEGLYQQLLNAERHAGGTAALADRRDAWPRLHALFRIVHEGSPHQELAIRDYGGALFRAGDLDSDDAVLRALAVLEEHGASDATVLRILRLLKIGRVKVRKGRTATWVSGPVDFSDLRTEYIGIIYEGLLDYELKRAPDDDAIVFLNVGRQPALPLARLEAMTDKQVKDLVATLRKDKAADTGVTDEGVDAGAVEEDANEEEPEDDDVAVEDAETGLDISDEALGQRAQAWAERAVEAAGLVHTRGKKKSSSEQARARAEAAVKLIDRVIAAKRLYLATRGGLRKGTGTFYTRPALAVPTTHRTLEPLCYDRSDNGLHPKTPEAILDLKVCDPAMGSGSFLVAALRYLTEALANALIAHDCLSQRGDHAVVTLPLGREATGAPHEELLPVPSDDDRFESLLRARLARHVVERCIYGVDINPMAVELARLALWVETLDRELPFEFLDHKIKVGNSLVGCWLHLALDYPAKAWEREAGDGQKGEQTKWLAEAYKHRVKPELKELLELRFEGKQPFHGMAAVESDPMDTVTGLRTELQAIHDLPTRDAREVAYRSFLESEAYEQIKALMDRWCAVWFWPTDQERREPALTPSEWADPSPAAARRVDALVDKHGFFHWEIEFADVYRQRRRGFDAVIGNPPWETVQPESLEFFSNHDPLYRTYKRPRAEERRKELFQEDRSIEADWLAYESSFKSFGHWLKCSEGPFDVSPARGAAGARLKEQWAQDRRDRPAVAHRDHPFRHQGRGKLYTYKAFLELAHHLLCDGGRLGFIVPSGVWTDMGSTDLRRLFLHRSRWEWCYGFENRRRIFPIDSRFKFAPVVAQRSGQTGSVKAAFMRHDVGEWERPDPPAIDITVRDIERFSPKTLSFLELKDDRDLQISEKLYADHPLLEEVVESLGATYRQELNMTSDSKLFVSLRKLAQQGLIDVDADDTRDPRVRARLWAAGYAPLYEGKSLWIQDPYYLSKRTTASVSRFVRLEDVEEALGHDDWLEPRLAFRDVASSTNVRTLVVGLMPPAVHGNKLPTIDGLGGAAPGLVALLGSLVLDYLIRMKVSTTLNWFYVNTLPIAKGWDAARFKKARDLVYRLNALGADFGQPAQVPLVGPAERMAARLTLDAFVADLYGLDVPDMEHIASRFPIYDKTAGEYSYPRLAVEVYQALCHDGPAAAWKKAKGLTDSREAAGVEFGLDKVYVPDIGWERANAEAKRILRAV